MRDCLLPFVAECLHTGKTKITFQSVKYHYHVQFSRPEQVLQSSLQKASFHAFRISLSISIWLHAKSFPHKS